MAALSNGRLSQKGTSLALRYLAEHGIVLVEDHPPSKLYTLNEQHLATSSIRALAGYAESTDCAVEGSPPSVGVPAEWGMALRLGCAGRRRGRQRY